MKTKIDKQKVSKLLIGLETLDVSKVTKEDKTLDLEALNKMPEVKKVVKELDKMGVTRKWLMRNFITAGMILHSLKN